MVTRKQSADFVQINETLEWKYSSIMDVEENDHMWTEMKIE